MEKRQAYLESHLSKEAVDLFWHPENGAMYDHSGTPWTVSNTPYYALEFRFGDVRR